MVLRPQARKKSIRSYVIRSGRMTTSQKMAFTEHWTDFGLNLQPQTMDFDQVFGRCAPRILEIGFGMGDSLLTMCEQDPDSDFIGIEVHPPGVGRAMKGAETRGIENFRVFHADARDVLSETIADASIARVQIYFPDPWHKKKHNKRRLVQADFIELVSAKLKPGGKLHLATDWQPYAEMMLDVLTEASTLKNLSIDSTYIERPDWRPETKFESRGARLGHGIWDLLFEKVV